MAMVQWQLTNFVNVLVNVDDGGWQMGPSSACWHNFGRRTARRTPQSPGFGLWAALLAGPGSTLVVGLWGPRAPQKPFGSRAVTRLAGIWCKLESTAEKHEPKC